MFYFGLYFVLLLPHVCHSSSENVIKLSNQTFLNKKPITEKILTKVPIISEGGVIPNNTILTENHTKINIEAEYENDERKRRVGKKGVVFSPEEDKSEKVMENIDKIIANNSTNATVVNNVRTQSQSKNISANETSKDSTLKNIVHKPLILSYEALSQTDKDNNIVINDIEPSIKIHALKSSGHPGMIMPIVITILVVPMFAVVGYMALKRGKEAWKNRHYKRMDFLLDGMYNE